MNKSIWHFLSWCARVYSETLWVYIDYTLLGLFAQNVYHMKRLFSQMTWSTPHPTFTPISTSSTNSHPNPYPTKYNFPSNRSFSQQCLLAVLGYSNQTRTHLGRQQSTGIVLLSRDCWGKSMMRGDGSRRSHEHLQQHALSNGVPSAAPLWDWNDFMSVVFV